MRKQQQIWETEHKEIDSLPSMASLEPSGGIVTFVEYLKEHRTRCKTQITLLLPSFEQTAPSVANY